MCRRQGPGIPLDNKNILKVTMLIIHRAIATLFANMDGVVGELSQKVRLSHPGKWGSTSGNGFTSGSAARAAGAATAGD